ncbi:DUF1836 domain-containing protein [Clostridium sp. MSJ-8]|uniref:DUF1836 domain-containing protein n=1 Tax=Clostridium sp. MSJ-8 TaxID=2841510 RepID=UPI001C0EF8EF|nr:DUF1836 domain-containing protein [Clostridium sp. MSJ-8]MBU5486751.1 DUF1836 domain-containing protein [Clostridium sp. MSJ-8]
MDKDKILEKINNNFNARITLDDMPELELYMDQVIQLFEGKLGNTKRTEEDKVLTKTMINNYAKAKLLMSVKNKRYSKEHLILMSMIYELKGSLSINDIKYVLGDIVEKYESDEEYDLRGLYNKFLDNNKQDTEVVIKDIEEKLSSVQDDSFEEISLLVYSFISISNMYRKAGEMLIDNYFKNIKEGSEDEK